MLNLIVILTAITQGLVALFVYQKKRDSISNISFSLLSLASLAWALTNYIYTLNPTSGSALFVTRLVLFWVVIQNTAFYVFANNYPESRLAIPAKKLQGVLLFSFVVAVATLSPFVFASVSIVSSQSNPNPGPLIVLFMAHAIYTIGSGLTSLTKKMHNARAQQRKQFQFILFASVLNWVVVPITNFFITLAFHTTFFAKVSPFYTLTFACIIAYTIVAQRLFDIRAAVARSVAYVMILGTTALLYGIGLFGFINFIFQGQQNETLRQILSLVLVAPLALSFQSIKQFFDRVTNKLFYRDSYDPQTVLDNLSHVIVAEIDLHKLLTNTQFILTDAIKSSYVDFLLYKKGEPYFESLKNNVAQINAEEISEHIKLQHKDILITDALSLQHPLRDYFLKHNIALSMRLKTQQQITGYIIFGEKRNGDIYNLKDTKLLSIAANELAIAVQNALRFEEIENFNITLQQKIDEATRKLRQTNDKLRALDETKDEFISMASHQLRTPLTSVKGYISMVLEGDAGNINDNQQKLLNQAFISSQRMVYLIADLLNVSRLRTGKFVIERKPTQLAEVIETEISQLIQTAKGRGLELTYDKPKDFPMLMLDETKIRQVIMNFADNAIYYTQSGPDRGHIHIGLEDKGTSVEFTVSDDGIGVPKEAQHHLFTKFYRAGNAQHARPDGTGLGLFMAKKVIVAQGGAIVFSSQEGKGSTFGFSFPKSELKVPDHLIKSAPAAKELVKKA